MTDSDFKVNDRRMFTADGELREGFEHLEDASRTVADVPASSAPEASAAAIASESPSSGSPEGASFLDLVGLLAQNAAVWLGDTASPDGQPVLNLGAAQMHIDLLDTLRHKTTGNLTAQEGAVIEDVLYRLRLAYVEKRRQEA